MVNVEFECFLDNQVLGFITLISPCLADNQLHIVLDSFYEKQRANVNQLVNILSKDGFPQTHLVLSCLLSKIGYVPNGGNKMKIFGHTLSDGQQQVIKILPHTAARQHQMGQKQKILESIKQDFHYSIQSVPQPFYISLFEANLNVQRSVEEKELTNETLAITPMQNGFTHICRHPTEQHEKWSKDAMNRLERSTQIHHQTNIVVDIPEF